jgi:hypothetical protein
MSGEFCCCGVQFKPEDMTNIMKDFDEPGHLAPTGLFLGATKYMVIQGEPGAVIRGKKVTTHRPSLLLLSVSVVLHKSLELFLVLFSPRDQEASL